MNIVTIIPARKGSKRLPDKNVKELCGKPLIEYTIDCCLKSRWIGDIIVSTDDNRIKPIVDKYNELPTVDIKFHRRPKELCQDDSLSQEFVDDILQHSKYKKYKFNCVVVLQPTSPLRNIEVVDKCIELYMNSDFESIITVKEISPYTYYPDGDVYVFKNKIWSDNMGLVVCDNDSVDINTKEDFLLAENRLLLQMQE